MAGGISVKLDTSELQAYLERLRGRLDEQNVREQMAKSMRKAQLAVARDAAKNTPVGASYKTPDGKAHTGGQLRRGFEAKNQPKPEVSAGGVTAQVVNTVEYAPYVEYGHRQQPGRYVPALGRRLKKSYVPGKHMLQDAVARSGPVLQAAAKEVIKNTLKGG